MELAPVRLTEAQLDFLYRHFQAWSELVDTDIDIGLGSQVVKCDHPKPLHANALSNAIPARSGSIVTCVRLEPIQIPLGSRDYVFAGKCPNCAKVYFTRHTFRNE